MDYDQPLSMTIFFDRPVKLTGTVKWKVKERLHFFYGIEFEDISEEKSAMIREYIQELFWENYSG